MTICFGGGMSISSCMSLTFTNDPCGSSSLMVKRFFKRLVFLLIKKEKALQG